MVGLIFNLQDDDFLLFFLTFCFNINPEFTKEGFQDELSK